MVTTRTHTVKQNNIDPAFESAKAENCTLSILREQDGLSFLVKNSKTNQLYMIGYMPAKELSEAPYDELLSSFSQVPAKVQIASDFKHSTVVPTSLNPKKKGWTKSLFGSEATNAFESKALGMTVLSVLNKDEQKDNGKVRHNWLAQMERITKVAGKQIRVDLGGTCANFYAQENNTYHLVSNLPVRSNEEVLYHLGNITEQLGWNRAEVSIEFSGVGHDGARTFVASYFKVAKTIDVSHYIKVSSALSKVDIASFGALLRL